MRKLLLGLLSFFSICSFGQLTITHNGKPKTQIICTDSLPNTQKAAQLLQHFVYEMSGAQLPIEQQLHLTSQEHNNIYLGGKTAKAGEDGFSIICQDNILNISSGGGNGIIYGVTELLEKYLHIDYLTYKTVNIPTNKDITIPTIHDIQTPSFEFRQTYSYGNADPYYKDWMRLEDHQDIFVDDLWVHTFNKILPASKYGKKHPEYYSLIKGKRQPGAHSQWCLTNENLFKEVCHNLDSIFKHNPDKSLIAISQNDGNDTYCTCEKCKQIDDFEEAHSGSLVRFLNKLADRYPDKKFITLAYLYTMHPPKHVRPADNVYIMLCDIDAKREVPLTENASGQDFVRALKGWSKITNHLFIWDYCINFDNVVEPFPNLHILQPNIQLFHKYGGKMIFEQSNGTIGTDMTELRAYLLAKLMWNVNADVDSLTQHFLKAYYGAAAPYISDYLKLQHGALLGSGKSLWIYDSPITHKNGMFSKVLMRRYNHLFDLAEQAVAHDSLRLEHVLLSRLPLQYSALEIARTEPMTPQKVQQLRKDVQLFRERCQHFHVPTLNERANRPNDYCNLYLQRYLPTDKVNYAKGCPIRYILPPAKRYEPIASKALTDGLYGGTTFVESWVGWEGQDGEFILDLQQPCDIHRITCDFLHQIGQWILIPKGVDYAISNDGRHFKKLGSVDFEDDRPGTVKFVPATYTTQKPVRAQYIRIHIRSIGNCPSWHYGVGYPAWFFIDEVEVN